jgi:hypothetical protein
VNKQTLKYKKSPGYQSSRGIFIRLDAMDAHKGVKTPFFRLFSFFFSSVALLRTQKKASTAKKMTVFAFAFVHRTKSI